MAEEFLEELSARRERAFHFARYTRSGLSIRAIRCIPENSSKAPRRAMIYGTPRGRNCRGAARFTAITGCLERTGKELTT